MFGPKFDPTNPPALADRDHSFCGCEPIDGDGAGEVVGTQGAHDRFRYTRCRREWLALTPEASR